MRYRILSLDELNEMSEEFLKFLAVQNILPEEWEKIKEQDPEQTNKLIEVFSDMVFDRIFSTKKYMRLITEDRLELMDFRQNDVHTIMLTSKEDSKINFLNADLSTLQINEVEIYQAIKPYTQEREKEMFDQTVRGATLVDGTMYKHLVLMITPL